MNARLRSVPMSGRELGEVGERVRIVRWATQNVNGKDTAVDDNENVPPGTTGTITGIQYDGTRFVKWDNGSTLNLLHDHDEWKVIADPICWECAEDGNGDVPADHNDDNGPLCEGCYDRRVEDGVIEDDPCCLLYKNMYSQDHEYGCPKAVAHRKGTS